MSHIGFNEVYGKNKRFFGTVRAPYTDPISFRASAQLAVSWSVADGARMRRYWRAWNTDRADTGDPLMKDHSFAADPIQLGSTTANGRRPEF